MDLLSGGGGLADSRLASHSNAALRPLRLGDVISLYADGDEMQGFLSTLGYEQSC